MISLNDLIKYAKTNNLDFDAPLNMLVEVEEGTFAQLRSIEQVGTIHGTDIALIETGVAYETKVFKRFGIEGVVNTMKFWDMEGKLIPDIL